MAEVIAEVAPAAEGPVDSQAQPAGLSPAAIAAVVAAAAATH